jgi:hypothetical protein
MNLTKNKEQTAGLENYSLYQVFDMCCVLNFVPGYREILQNILPLIEAKLQHNLNYSKTTTVECSGL